MRGFFVAAALAAFSINANAVVINTLDGVDYEWLELTETQGLSRNQVEAELLDMNSDLYGYKYASRAQVGSLLISYASWDGASWDQQDSHQGDAGVVAGIQALFNDFGATSTAPIPSYQEAFETDDGHIVQLDSYVTLHALYGQEADYCHYDATFMCVASVFLWHDATGNPAMV
jgi:hypothetical protein